MPSPDTGPGAAPGPERMGGGRRAAFLDRDGTIMREREYLADPDGVELIPGAAEGLRRLRDAGYLLVLVTNQSGIARGKYTEADFHAVQARLQVLLSTAGVTLDGVYHCPHHPDFTGPCRCRKPGTAMFEEAARDLGIDLAASVAIGDRPRDVEPGLRLGARAILVRTGYGSAVEVLADGVEAAADLAEAARMAGRQG